MGVVYKAEDTKLERTVALKFLAAHLLNDEEAKARFLREARAAAGLDHPNICTVYEVGEAEGKTFLSMAFIKGEPLEARIEQGPLPLKDVLDIGRQVAEGLGAAHEEGVVHRDIKPANVMVDAKGRATIMDFGLARLTEASRLTKADQTMGTVAYMSPEQAQGMEVDNRSDIWALGVVLYEMVRGQRPFQGEYDQALLFEIVHQEPEPLTGVRAGVPMELEFIVGKCLAKDREDRPASAQEIARDLRTLGEKLKSGRSRIMTAGVSGQARVPVTTGADAALATGTHAGLERNPKLPWAIAAVAVLSAVVLAFLHLTETRPERPVYELAASLPHGSELHTFRISPDGRHLAFAVQGPDAPLLVRSLDSVELRALEGTEGATYPFWSPDSRYIGFFAQGKLKKVPLAGGPAQSLCDARDGRGGTWNQEGVILFAPNPFGGFEHVSAGGGEPTPVSTGDDGPEASRRFPDFLPDGQHFLYLANGAQPDETGVFLGSIGGILPRRLLSDTSNGLYVPGASAADGFILFVREGTLMAQPFDAGRTELTGDLFPVVEGVARAANLNNRAFSASSSGILAFVDDRTSSLAQLTWFDREGSVVEQVDKPQSILMLDLSPDEKRVALSKRDGTWDIWIYELARDTMTRFTSDPRGEIFPIWSPDGAFIVFALNRGGMWEIYQKPTSGAGEAELVLPQNQQSFLARPLDWSHDKQFLLYQKDEPNRSFDIWVLPLNKEQEPFPLLATEFRESGGRFSPDGRWVAYEGNRSGRVEVYIRPFPKADRETKISTEGGSAVRWRGDGKELYYIAPDGTLMAVPMEGGEAIGVPKALFPTRMQRSPAGNHGPTYDVTSDGQRFLVANLTEEAGRQTVTVITDWRAQVRD